MIGVDLFSGAGGMSIGASMAGVTVRVAVESDKYAAETFRANHKKAKIYCADIRKIDKIEIKNRNAPLIVFGGPPCQGFSTSNQRNRSKTNANNWLFVEFIRHVRSLDPEFVVVENVKGLENTENGMFLDAISNEISALGYNVSYSVLNASDYGVPQTRNRLFIVGQKNGTYSFPVTNGKQKVTVSEAISDLPTLENGSNNCELPYRNASTSKFARTMRAKQTTCSNNLVSRNSSLVLSRYAHVPQGGNWENIPESLMSNYADRSRCHTGIYRRLDEDKPSVVLGNFRKNMLIHPTENRGLSVREAARLQSFPDRFIFKGTIGFQQQQVGNAVPPLLAKAVFEQLSRNAL